jgi:hypothetical protein
VVIVSSAGLSSLAVVALSVPKTTVLAVAFVALLLSAVALGRAVRSVRSTGHLHAAIGVVSGILLIVAVTVPALAALTGARESKLSRLGYPLVASPDRIAQSCLLLAASFAVFGLAAVTPRQSQQPRRLARADVWRAAHTNLLMLGLLGSVLSRGASRAQAFADRGAAQGAGALAALYWALALVVALGLTHRHFDSRIRALLSALAVVLLISSGNRSPLLLICAAVLVRVIQELQVRRLRWYVLSALTAFGYLVVSLAAGLSMWRGSIIQGSPISLLEAVRGSVSNPLPALASSGFDSLDGFMLSQDLSAKGFQPVYTDFLNGVINLVPRAIWPDKPAWLSATISEDYLGITRSGIFLSGLGYFSLTLGSLAAGYLALALIGRLMGLISLRFSHVPIIVTLATYFSARLLMGGDAFDLFHTLTLAGITAIAYVGARTWRMFTDG